MKSVSESLAGRAGVYELLPMSYSEITTHASEKDLDTFLYDGLFPAIYAGKNTAKLFYPSYVRTYIEKDIRDLLNIKDSMLFFRFLKLCAARIGSVFNANELSGFETACKTAETVFHRSRSCLLHA